MTTHQYSNNLFVTSTRACFCLYLPQSKCLCFLSACVVTFTYKLRMCKPGNDSSNTRKRVNKYHWKNATSIGKCVANVTSFVKRAMILVINVTKVSCQCICVATFMVERLACCDSRNYNCNNVLPFEIMKLTVRRSMAKQPAQHERAYGKERIGGPSVVKVGRLTRSFSCNYNCYTLYVIRYTFRNCVSRSADDKNKIMGLPLFRNTLLVSKQNNNVGKMKTKLLSS